MQPQTDSTPIGVTIGIEEAIRVVVGILEKFAAPGKLQPFQGKFENWSRMGEVDIWFDTENVGVARFFFVTWDNISCDVRVDFSVMDRDYLEEMAQRVVANLNEQREKRIKSGKSVSKILLN